MDGAATAWMTRGARATSDQQICVDAGRKEVRRRRMLSDLEQTAAPLWRSSICARVVPVFVLFFVLVWAIAVLVIHD